MSAVPLVVLVVCSQQQALIEEFAPWVLLRHSDKGIEILTSGAPPLAFSPSADVARTWFHPGRALIGFRCENLLGFMCLEHGVLRCVLVAVRRMEPLPVRVVLEFLEGMQGCSTTVQHTLAIK